MPIVIKCKSCGFEILRIENHYDLNNPKPFEKIVKVLGYAWVNGRHIIVKCPCCLSPLPLKIVYENGSITIDIDENEVGYEVKPRF